MRATKLHCVHIMTVETMSEFIAYTKRQGASENMLRRFSCTVNALYDFLPADKTITKERLISWRKNMEDRGYASMTILNYVKYINRYLDFVGCSDLRFNRGKGKDISGMTFGYLTALEPTDKRNRKDIVWRCQCKCGNAVELPATRLLVGNTMSCGFLLKEHFQRANMYIDNTSLRQALEEKVESVHSVSGYTGVTPKRGKWQAYITYKGKHYSLGYYTNLEDAVKARKQAEMDLKADPDGFEKLYQQKYKHHIYGK